MASINELNQLKKQFIDLKSNVGTIISCINDSVVSLNEASNTIATCFSIDDIVADNSNFNDRANDMRAIISSFSYSVIPSIDAKIASIDSEIRILESLEEIENANLRNRNK